MHRHLLVFIPPVITVPWHGDSIGGEGHSTEHGTTTARRAGGRGDIPWSLCSSPGRNKDGLPSRDRDTTAPGKGCCGLSSAPGRDFVPLWCQFGLQHPPSRRDDERDRVAGPSRLAPSEGPSRARGLVFLAGMGCRFSCDGYGTRGGGCSTPCLVLARQNRSLPVISRRLSGKVEAEPQLWPPLRGQRQPEVTLLPCNLLGSGGGTPCPGTGGVRGGHAGSRL